MKGHWLVAEGAAFDEDGNRVAWNTVAGRGRGHCSCGAVSAIVPSSTQRKQWHRYHKAEVSQ